MDLFLLLPHVSVKGVAKAISCKATVGHEHLEVQTNQAKVFSHRANAVPGFIEVQARSQINIFSQRVADAWTQLQTWSQTKDFSYTANAGPRSPE